MLNTFSKIRSSFCRYFVVAVLTVLLALCAGFSSADAAVKGGQKRTYPSPEAAVKALVDAVKSQDRKQMTLVLGPEAHAILLSGDEIADREALENFAQRYEEKNRIEREGEFKAVLLVGQKDWPLPIPIVKKGQGWLFDTKKGKEEVLNRRIGRNELAVIKVCEAYVDAQQEYADMQSEEGGLARYARKFWSTPGKRDGLYWETKEGEKPSPFGPFAAKAKTEGYVKKSSSDHPQPYYGYFYRILQGQGSSAKGGAFDYVVNGDMIGGFALVAYPARYGNSGIMTFIVNQDGVVYQKNLGKDTAKRARAMNLFNPDKTWKKVETDGEGSPAGTDSGCPGEQGGKE